MHLSLSTRPVVNTEPRSSKQGLTFFCGKYIDKLIFCSEDAVSVSAVDRDVCLYVCLPVYLLACLSACLPVCRSVCVFVCVQYPRPKYLHAHTYSIMTTKMRLKAVVRVAWVYMIVACAWWWAPPMTTATRPMSKIITVIITTSINYESTYTHSHSLVFVARSIILLLYQYTNNSPNVHIKSSLKIYLYCIPV